MADNPVAAGDARSGMAVSLVGTALTCEKREAWVPGTVNYETLHSYLNRISSFLVP